MRDRSEIGNATQERIVATALRLFAEKGFAAVGIREIATEAGLSSATLYHYMGSKADLLREIMTDRLGRLITATRQALAGLERPQDKLVTVVRVHVLVHALHPDSVVDHQLWDLDADARKTIVALRDEYEGIWRATLDEGISEPAVFSIPCTRLTRLALLEMCNGVGRWYHPGGLLRPEQIADYFATLALGMVGARRGRRAIGLQDISGPSVQELLDLLAEAYPT